MKFLSRRSVSFQRNLTSLIAIGLSMASVLLSTKSILIAHYEQTSNSPPYTQSKKNIGKKDEQPIDAVSPLQKVSKQHNGTKLPFQKKGKHNGTASPLQPTEEGLSICMIIKDDNEILSEWIAYHYHVTKLRYLIIAVDPTGKTRPTHILDKWRSTFSNLIIEEWSDEMYMPDFFLNRDEEDDSNENYRRQSPLFFPGEILNNRTQSEFHNEPTDPEKVRQDIWTVNDYLFRQYTFYTQCIHELRHQRRTWMTLIDSDEFLVPNPYLRQTAKNKNYNRRRPSSTVYTASLKPAKAKIPKKPIASSFYDLLTDMFSLYPTYLSRSCQVIPSITFGNKETTNKNNAKTKTSVAASQFFGKFNETKFETRRWKYRKAYDDPSNPFQKVLFDVSSLSPTKDDLLQMDRVENVHCPSNTLCKRSDCAGGQNIQEVRKYPFIIHHYVGSYEKFKSREDVPRTDFDFDHETLKTNVKDDGWIDGWLDDFFETEGIEKVAQVFGETYFVKKCPKVTTESSRLQHERAGWSPLPGLVHCEKNKATRN